MKKDSSLLSLVLFIIIITLVYSVQNMISPNILEISNYFGYAGDLSQLGFLTFSFTILSGISMIIFGYLADKITRKWIVLLGTIIYSTFACLVILVPKGISGYNLFFFLTCMSGIGFGAIVPSIFSLIGDLISQDDRSKGFSFFSIATLLGMLVGIILATSAGTPDWRVPFLVIGIAGLINSVIILFFQEPARIGKDHLDIMKRDEIDYTYRIKKDDLKEVFKKKSNIWLILNFVDTIPTGIILFLLWAYMDQIHNVPEDVALAFLAFIFLSTLLGTIIFGIIGDNMFKKGKKKARVYLALMANVVPIPFVFIGLMIPFQAPDGVTMGGLFLIPGAVLMLSLTCFGLFINGATNGSWYATVADINLPEHRGTVLATANFFDILGRAIGPWIGAVVADALDPLAGINLSIIFWLFLPFFWIPVLKHVIPEMEATERIFLERIESLKESK
jgi:MFS family permease